MGGLYTNKALLLDERDIEQYCGWPSETFEDLCEIAYECAVCNSGTWENPWMETISFASERFNMSELTNLEKYSPWVGSAQNWNQALVEIFTGLGQLERLVSEQFLKVPDKERLMQHIAAEIGSAVSQESFHKARALVTAIENLQGAGLPCFRKARELTSGGDDDAYDLREKDWGAGRRVIVGVVFGYE